MFHNRNACQRITCTAVSHLLSHTRDCAPLRSYYVLFWFIRRPLTLAPERCKCPKNIMAPFLCKSQVVKEDNQGCHDNRVQKADCAAFACRTSNGVSKLHRGWCTRLWFELASDFHSLSSNSRSIWNTPFKKKKEGGKCKKREKRGSDSPHPDRPRDLDFIIDNYLICFISMLPQGLAGRTSGLFAV